MRVIAGKAKGLRLKSPGSDGTRPVADRVKESVFSILGNIEDLSVLDIFAGSGAMGIEAISRGAKSGIFIELDKKVSSILKENLIICKFDDCSKVMSMDYRKALKLIGKDHMKFDLIFIDPPYFKDMIPKALELIKELNILSKNGLILTEHNAREELDPPKGFVLTDSRSYGQTQISFLKSI